MSNNNMKVFGGFTFQNGDQVRTIIAAKSKKRAAELVGVSMYRFNDYWSETGNRVENETALSSPETVFVSSDRYEKNFQPLVKEQ